MIVAGGFIIAGALVAILAIGGLLWLGGRVIDAIGREIAVLFGGGETVVHAATDAPETVAETSGKAPKFAAPVGWDPRDAEMSHG